MVGGVIGVLHKINYGIIGKDLDYTLAPEVHNQFFDAYSIDGKYDVIDLKESHSTSDILDILMQYKGINVSAPYKKPAMKILDEISENARNIGYVNTINNVNGKLYGYNTDVEGFKGLLDIHHLNARGKSFVILGSGSIAKSAVFVLKKMTKNITVVTRNLDEVIDGATIVGYDKLKDLKADVLVHATNTGVYPNVNEMLMTKKELENYEYVIDLVYNPIYTKLLKTAVKCGKKCISGLYMLVCQAMRSESFWQGFDMSSAVKRIYSQVNIIEKNKANANVYLVGMMGSGKTELSKQIAKATNRQFIELDDLIQKMSGLSVNELYEQGGEELFRQWEEKAIIKVSQLKNKVVALGCGTVLKERNVLTLKLSGIVILRDRPIDDILRDIDLSNRQGVQSKEDVIRLYNERYPLYVELSDYILPYGNIEKDLEKVLEILK